MAVTGAGGLSDRWKLAGLRWADLRFSRAALIPEHQFRTRCFHRPRWYDVYEEEDKLDEQRAKAESLHLAPPRRYR
jgi:hypothetical protein